MATVAKAPRLRSGRLRAHGAAGVLGEYDGNLQDGSGHNNLLRKYIYGPGVDQASVANYPTLQGFACNANQDGGASRHPAISSSSSPIHSKIRVLVPS
jgi:hypothetical protein